MVCNLLPDQATSLPGINNCSPAYQPGRDRLSYKRVRFSSENLGNSNLVLIKVYKVGETVCQKCFDVSS